MSSTFAPYTIVSALQELLKIGKATIPWEPMGKDSPRQKAFLDAFLKDIPKNTFSPKELETLGGFEVSAINVFLRSKGFDIQLKQQDDPHALYSASVMNVLVHWKIPGTESTVYVDKKQYPAVLLKEGCFRAFTLENWGFPLSIIQTDNGDTAFITVAEKPVEGEALVQVADKLMRGTPVRRGAKDYEKLLFPMVDLDRQEDLSWFEGMSFMGIDRTSHATPFYIAQALNQNKLKINHLGARAESATAFGATRGISFNPTLVIDRPFLFWLTRRDLGHPYFCAYVTEEDWKNPGKL